MTPLNVSAASIKNATNRFDFVWLKWVLSPLQLIVRFKTDLKPDGNGWNKFFCIFSDLLTVVLDMLWFKIVNIYLGLLHTVHQLLLQMKHPQTWAVHLPWLWGYLKMLRVYYLKWRQQILLPRITRDSQQV